MTRHLRSVFKIILLLASSYLVFSCANMAAPSGGPYDFDPPKVMKITPGVNATDVEKGKIVIQFNKLVKLDKPSDKIIVTPPQRRSPAIEAIGNKVIVQLKDTLLANTTYTVDFTDAVQDNNEGNTLDNFSVSFSTGSVVDTLSVSGKILAANNLEPVKGIFVGLHSNLNDSAFTKLPFDHISRTNDQGMFTIKGVAAGKYKIYALNDLTHSYKYDDPSEDVAFLDSIIVPSHVRAMRTDTIFAPDTYQPGAKHKKKKSTNDSDSADQDPTKRKVDSVKQVEYTRFLPDNIVLRSFSSTFKRQYFQSADRTQDNYISIFFGAPTSMPKIEPLNFDKHKNWGLIERNLANDSIHYWITDSLVSNMDTLKFRITYPKTDSLNRAVMTTDTLKLINRNRKSQQKQKEKREKEHEKNKKKNKKEKLSFLQIKTNLSNTWDMNTPILMEFEEPVSDFDASKIKLQQLKDSTYTDEPLKIVRDSLNPRTFKLAHKWDPGEQYRLTIDSASFHGYSHLWNTKISEKFKIKTLDQYGNLYITIHGLDKGVPAFVELLNASDTPVRKAYVKDGGVVFINLNPQKYYARLIVDKSDNGKWNTGNYMLKQQPDAVYYYPKYWNIKANFDYPDEVWNIKELPLDKQKPLEITKNKPIKKETKREQMEKRDAKKNASSTDNTGSKGYDSSPTTNYNSSYDQSRSNE